MKNSDSAMNNRVITFRLLRKQLKNSLMNYNSNYQQLKLQHADQVDPSYPIPPQDHIGDTTPGDHINVLRQEIFDYVPPTVNKRGCCSL